MRFFLSLIGVVIFVVVAIILIASNGHGRSTTKPINITNYNTDFSSLVQTTTGELVGDDQRQAIRITITQSSREIDILTGYNQAVTNTESFSNNATAYGVFLGAMQNAMYTNSRSTSEKNMFGVCPLGNTFQYELNGQNGSVTNLWSTSCSFSDGTFAGNGPLIRQLFSLQIPNYTTFVQPTGPTISDPTT